jgi:hypothetical protein
MVMFPSGSMTATRFPPSQTYVVVAAAVPYPTVSFVRWPAVNGW